MLDVKAALIGVFAGVGASVLQWQAATRCTCWDPDTEQPEWGCPTCGGYGAAYAPAVPVRVLFRGQSRWTSSHIEGELPLGEAQLTTPAFTAGAGVVACLPGYTDRRVRDRFTVPAAVGDDTRGRVFLPAASPVPFLIGNQQLAWRVQLQSLEQANRTTPQP